MSSNFLFPFTEEHEMIRQTAREFAQTRDRADCSGI